MTARRVALYARVSTPEQDPEVQLDRLRDLARSRGWVVVAEYADIASGADMKRPKLDKMVAAARKGEFNTICAVRLDRLARSVVGMANLAEDLDAMGVAMVLLDQPIDTSTSMGRFVRTILSATAEIERDLIRERTNDGLAKARKAGRRGGRKPRRMSQYQLDKARAILADDPDISQRALCEQFDGISRPAVLRCLREEGILPGKGEQRWRWMSSWNPSRTRSPSPPTSVRATTSIARWIP